MEDYDMKKPLEIMFTYAYPGLRRQFDENWEVLVKGNKIFRLRNWLPSNDVEFSNAYGKYLFKGKDIGARYRMFMSFYQYLFEK